MRDSLLKGIEMMIRLYAGLAVIGTADAWNFVHVIITDGEDTSSTNSQYLTSQKLSQVGSKIPAELLKTWFIGVDISKNSTAARDISQLVNSAAGHVSFQLASDSNLEEMFQKIRIDLGLIKKTDVVGLRVGDNHLIGVQEEYGLYMQASRVNYCVLFNVDMSGSMYSKWPKVCKAIQDFVNFLGPDDLVAGLVFNDCVTLLNTNEIDLESPPKPTYTNTGYNQNTRRNHNTTTSSSGYNSNTYGSNSTRKAVTNTNANTYYSYTDTTTVSPPPRSNDSGQWNPCTKTLISLLVVAIFLYIAFKN